MNDREPNRQTSEEICLKDVSVYYGKTQALEDVSLTVQKGEYVGVIGPNGGGKSTLLNTIAGIVKPTFGTVSVFGRSPSLARGVGYVPQLSDIDRKFPMTVLQTVLTGMLPNKPKPFYTFTKKDRTRALELIESMELLPVADRLNRTLSMGQFQKMLIARALAVTPSILLLDEPTASVDVSSAKRIYARLTELNRSGLTIVLVTHDLAAVAAQTGSLACLNRTLVYHGIPKMDAEVVKKLYGCPIDLLAHGISHRVLNEHEQEDCHDTNDS